LHRPKDTPTRIVGLGWGINTSGTDEIIWKNGGTGGYRTFIGFVVRTGVGVVVLSNTSTRAGVDDIGMHLLDGRNALLATTGFPKEGVLEPRLLPNYVGRYELSPGVAYVITRDGGRLYAQATDQARFALYPINDGPINDRQFFAKLVDVQIDFEINRSGRADALTLRMNGHDQRAKRVAETDKKVTSDAGAVR
jgi:serine-type D-Ala-D-Ala carboxypeptidase/endopeptidase